jgi:hypothetical protein
VQKKSENLCIKVVSGSWGVNFYISVEEEK